MRDYKGDSENLEESRKNEIPKSNENLHFNSDLENQNNLDG